jgi:hypothetical protein
LGEGVGQVVQRQPDQEELAVVRQERALWAEVEQLLEALQTLGQLVELAVVVRDPQARRLMVRELKQVVARVEGPRIQEVIPEAARYKLRRGVEEEEDSR